MHSGIRESRPVDVVRFIHQRAPDGKPREGCSPLTRVVTPKGFEPSSAPPLIKGAALPIELKGDKTPAEAVRPMTQADRLKA